MFALKNFGRVYLNLSRDFFTTIDSNFRLDDVFNAVAQSCKIGFDGRPLIINGCVANIATRAHILNRAKAIVAHLGETPSEETMAKYISHNQIKNLLKAFRKKQGKIPGFALLILHAMYTLIQESDPSYPLDFRGYVVAIFNVADDYYQQFGDDVSRFLVDCYAPVLNRLDQPGKILLPEELPDLPRGDIPDCEYE